MQRYVLETRLDIIHMGYVKLQITPITAMYFPNITDDNSNKLYVQLITTQITFTTITSVSPLLLAHHHSCIIVIHHPFQYETY